MQDLLAEKEAIMAVVLGKDRVTGKKEIINIFKTDHAAERFCEMWGWRYDDGTKTYSMEIIPYS